MPTWIDTLQRKSLNVSAVETTGNGCLIFPSIVVITTVVLPVMRKCRTSVVMVHLLVPRGPWLSQVLAWLPPPVLFSSAPVHHVVSSPLPYVLRCRWWHNPSFSPILSRQHLTGSTGTVSLGSQGGLVWTWRKCNRFVLLSICKLKVFLINLQLENDSKAQMIMMGQAFDPKI